MYSNRDGKLAIAQEVLVTREDLQAALDHNVSLRDGLKDSVVVATAAIDANEAAIVLLTEQLAACDQLGIAAAKVDA